MCPLLVFSSFTIFYFILSHYVVILYAWTNYGIILFWIIYGRDLGQILGGVKCTSIGIEINNNNNAHRYKIKYDEWQYY